MSKKQKKARNCKSAGNQNVGNPSFKRTQRYSTKIFLSYHRRDKLLKDEILTPIHAGREMALQRKGADLDWLLKNTIGDNTGDNISLKNSSYNEITSVYWVWKNYSQIGDPKYVGFMHYRRHLMFKGGEKSVYELGDIDKDYLSTIGYTPQRIDGLMSEHDFICPKPQYRASLYEHYKRNHCIEDLDRAIAILKSKYPDYASDADAYLAGKKAYFCNMFVFPKEIFFDYCTYLFDILFEFEKQTDLTEKRLYISEWLTGIYITRLLSNGKKACFLPTTIAESEHIIPVVFAADNQYAIPLAVAMTSLLHNAKETTIYKIYALVPGDFDELNKTRILKLLDRFPKCSIDFIDIREHHFGNVTIKTQHLTKVAFYRLLIANLLPNAEKCIYLDVDLIVLQDLSVFFRYSLDDAFVAGIKAPGFFYPESWAEQHSKELGIPIDQYINSGVLLMNLARIRKFHMTEKFVELSDNNYSSEDQDVINVACYGKIKHLPFRFNVMTKYLVEGDEENGKMKKVIPADEIADAKAHPCIIHYANRVKPWQDHNVIMADRWMEYAALSPFIDILANTRAYKLQRSRELMTKIKQINQSTDGMDAIECEKFADEYGFSSGNVKVSIIIPVYNAAKYLEHCIDNCILQIAALKNIEIICIDDGSTDASPEILDRYAARYPFIVILKQNNSGAGAARNKGLDVARGEFVAFMDADDWYPSPTVLENLYMTAKKNQALICGGSFSSYRDDKVNFRYKGLLEGYTFHKREMIQYADYQFDYGYTRFIYRLGMLRKHKIRFPDYRRFQDPPFMVKAMLAAGKFYAVPEITYRYRLREDGVCWDELKVCDLLRGMIDNLNISREHKLAKLHVSAFNRVKDYLAPINRYVLERNMEVFVLVIKMQGSIDIPLLRAGGLRLSEHYMIEPLQLLLDEAVKDRKEIIDIRSSWTYKIGRFFTFIPRKLREFVNRRKALPGSRNAPIKKPNKKNSDFAALLAGKEEGTKK